jgi:WhiB family redox-sensing transcriptional regulator
MPTEYWFPSAVGHTGPGHKIALATCGRCPVQLDCLRHATEEGEYWGTWGGMTESQRRDMRRRTPRRRGRDSA